MSYDYFMRKEKTRDVWDAINRILKDMEDGMIPEEAGLSLLEDILEAETLEEIENILYEAGYLDEDQSLEPINNWREFKKELRKLVNGLEEELSELIKRLEERYW